MTIKSALTHAKTLATGFVFLLHKEVDLAEHAAKQEATLAVSAVAKFVIAAIMLVVTFFFLSVAAAFALAYAMPTFLAFAVVGAVYLLIALVLLLGGKSNLRTAKNKPKELLAAFHHSSH